MIKKYEGYKWGESIKPEWWENTLLTDIGHQPSTKPTPKNHVLSIG